MEEKSQRVVKEGNAFYEIDLECLEKKKKEEARKQKQPEKRQRE